MFGQILSLCQNDIHGNLALSYVNAVDLHNTMQLMQSMVIDSEQVTVVYYIN